MESIESYKNVERVKWVTSWPGQAVLCVSQFYWTQEVHLAIKGGPEVRRSAYYSQFCHCSAKI